jgi:hypothetical protein
VSIAVNKGLPITIGNPGHPVSQAITAFAREKLLPAPAPRGGLLRGLGRRRSA